MDEHWQVYLEKMRLLEDSIKLVAYHTLEASKECMKATLAAHETAEAVRDFIRSRDLTWP